MVFVIEMGDKQLIIESMVEGLDEECFLERLLPPNASNVDRFELEEEIQTKPAHTCMFFRCSMDKSVQDDYLCPEHNQYVEWMAEV